MGEDDVEAGVGKGKIMRVTDIERDLIGKRFGRREFARGGDEFGALIDTDGATREIRATRESAQRGTGSATDLQHAARGTGHQLGRIAIEQMREYLVLGPALQSCDQALDRCCIELIDEPVRISCRH